MIGQQEILGNNNQEHPIDQTGHCWELESPSEKFLYFYKKKAECISTFLTNGEIPFEQYTDYLMSASIDLSDMIYDYDILTEQKKDLSGGFNLCAYSCNSTCTYM